MLCGGGWFAVEAAAPEGDTLKSIDLRFEMECGLPTSLLRNYVYFESQLDPSLGPPQKYLYTPDHSQIVIDAGVALLMRDRRQAMVR